MPLLRRFPAPLLLALVILLCAAVAVTCAQANGSRICGVVADVDGIPVAGAVVKLSNDGGDEVRATLTDDRGRYRFDNIVPGAYKVRAAKPTFRIPRPAARSLKAGETARIDMILKLAAGATTVE